MALFSWDDRYALGHTQIDREHEALFALARQVLEAMDNGSSKPVVRDLFDRLINYTQLHFAHEETLMNEHRYSGTDAHMTEHRKFIGQVMEFHRQFEADQLEIDTETLQFLRNWLYHHIRQSDQLLVVHIRRRERVLTHT